MLAPTLRGCIGLVKAFGGHRQLKAMKGLNAVPVRTIYPSSSSNVIAGPARTKISPVENLAAFVFIFGCVFSFPAYIMSHMDDYRTLPGQQKEEAGNEDE